MKKALFKNNLKTISKTRRRFLSILVMAFLGVGFYSGLVATSPDMLDSLDQYTRNTKFFDIHVVSTLGLTQDDVNAIKNVEGIENTYGIQTKDSMAQFNNKESICKVIEYNENINVPVLVSGRMPENSNECLLDEGYLMTGKVEDYIGKTIVLNNDDTNSDDTLQFNQKEFKVVGIVESPLYISTERGNTTIGSGNISFYIYVKDDVIHMDYDTEIYATVKNANQYVTNSEEYLALVNPVLARVEEIKEERENARYNELVKEANEKLEDARREYEDKKKEVETELADAEKQIQDAKTQIRNSESKLQQSEKELTSQEANLEKQFSEAENKLKEAEEQITTKSSELEQGKKVLENKKTEANAATAELDKGISDLKSKIEMLQSQKDTMEQNGLDTTEIDNKISELNVTKQGLEKQKSEIENAIKAAQTEITLGETEIAKAKTELQGQKNSLETNKKTAYDKIANGKAEIKSGKQKLETAKAELSEKEKEYEDGKNEAIQKLNEAEEELNDAEDKIKKIEKAKWYLQDRLDNIGYANIFDAIKTMTNISKIFPIIFYLVAVLISLTSMTRMIEEERVEIGTLKSLGYTNMQIISKYVLYAFLACVIGGIIGMSVGFYLLPNVVWILYSTIYTIPNFYASYQLKTGLMGIVIAFLCIGGATIFVAYKELKQMPAVLMRPKPPKNGKRIFLERIRFIWKRLNFSQKVTMRNIFRYKKRAIMTIVGIAGCTGLMLTGFGIKDSVIDIPNAQYGKIFQYEAMVSLSNTNGLNELEEYIASNENIEDASKIYATTGKLTNENSNYDVTVFVPEDSKEFSKVCNLADVSTDEKLTLSTNGIIITDKVAEFLNVKQGETITFVDSNNAQYEFKVDAIAKNYVSHYVYMSKEFLETNLEPYQTNMLLINTGDISDEAKNEISEKILTIEGVSSVSLISSLVEAIQGMLDTMNYVVVILIVASALLAFVVLYNLANINIGERQREIATLKVLGFYDKEVDNYINKENIIFTMIGILLGLVFGVFLTNAIITSVEIDKLRFMIRISPLSYVYSAIITASFSLIVNWIIHFILKKIDMIESLKSVE
ncbi:MAG: FtsX-like permease family protein [Clostridia bacterium]|nr:FtsX-like permease family protein [Clostridia bacterium]